MARTALAFAFVALSCGLLPAPAAAQAPLRKIGEMELQLAGLGAVLDPVNPVVPKNTPAGVQVIVRAGGRQLTAAEVESLVGGAFFLEAEVSGPGLPRTITIPDLESGDPLLADPLILPLPGLSMAGDYELTNIRIVAGGRAVMGVLPEVATLKVIDQVLVTKLVTRSLTLDELREKGIEITSNDYTGFQFSLALRLESEVVNLDFPVVFDRQGVVVPQPIDTRVTDPTRKVETPAVPRPPAMIVPLMLLPEGESDAGPRVPLTLPNGEPIRIPAVLVIPGNVGYLKQFFSAVVYVANGTPAGSRLFVRDIVGRIALPPGKDLAPGTPDDPLYLAKRIGEAVPPAERAILGLGPDEAPGSEDDVSVFAPGEQGQTEWVLVGNDQGFHKIDISLAATLDGLATGPVKVKGSASGGVLVRNPYFDVTFTVPSVVREGETFQAAITLNNIGEGDARDVHIEIDAARMSGLELLSPAEQDVLAIPAGEAHAFEYKFKSLRTGKVVATYLRFDAQPGAQVSGQVDFTIGVTDEGVPLSPDTLVLPASVNLLPPSISYAAMRVLGQAWSIANAPRGSLPARVTRITRAQVEAKALALAEAGLRVTLRPEADREAALHEALRDLLLDFWGGDPVDPGFDRLLREGAAGQAFALALGSALAPAADAAGGPAAFERSLAKVAASGLDFLSLSVEGPADFALTDSLGRVTIFERAASGRRVSAIPGAALLPLGPAETAPLLGLLTQPDATGYRLEVTGPAAITLTAPQAGAFVRGTVISDGRGVLAIDLARPGAWVLEHDTNGDGTLDSLRDVAMETLESEGPQLLAATLIGSETLPRAGDFGLNAVLVFDRPVEAARASDTSSYSIPKNSVAFARPQLSGRLVFATLAEPEGPNVPTEIAVSGIADRRGFSRDATARLASRLTRGGAWLSGQVREADGTPVDEGAVVYYNVSDAACALGGRPGPLTRIPLGPGGSYELRYVRQAACGFEVAAADRNNALLRRLEGRVRRPGERIFLDLVLLGEGAVEGFVYDLAGQPVAGATVAASSGTDARRGGAAVTDATGYYRIAGLPVGLVSVKAGRGAGLGSATGRVERAGTAARIDVTLDSGTVSVSGRFSQVKDGVERPVASALISFLAAGGAAGYLFTDATGAYRFEGMPVGDFTIMGDGSGPFGHARANASGRAAAGDSLENVVLVHVAKPEVELGSVSGRVVLPGGAPAVGVFVAQDVSSAFIDAATGTDAEGRFVLSGLPVGVNLSIGAITSDRRRKGSASAHIPPDTREQMGVEIVLSAIGSARFTVLGANGARMPNQEVALLGVGGFAGVCRNPCGCRTGTTDGQGVVSFSDLPLGGYTAQAVRREGSFTESATGTALLSRDGEPGFGTLQFLGSGTVSGTLSLDSPTATFTGGSVSLVSRAFVNDGLFTCGMVPKESHRAQLNPLTSRYEFKGVAVGAVSATGRGDLGVAGNRGNLARAGETLTLDLVLADTIAGEVSGRVLLPSGTPAGAGVEVTVNGPLPDVTVSTDSDSRFVFARVLPSGNYRITARDPVTGGVVRESIYLRVGQDLQHELRLKGRGTVRVKVEDALGAAVDRAFVTLLEQEYPQRRHDRSIEPTLLGVATFEGVFEGPFSVEVRDLVGRGGRGSGAVPAPDASVDVTLRLNPTGSVAGTFVMPDRTTPIPYALVTLVVNGRAVGQATTPGTGPMLGRFSFDYVPAGSVRVEAEDPLTLRTGFAVDTLEAGEEELGLLVVAKGLGTVEGRVLARVAGGPDETRPGASVRIQAGSYAGATLADAQGEYVFGGVPEGPVSVTASIGDQALRGSASGAITTDGELLPLDVYVRDSGRVSGRVLRSDGVTPAPPSRVTIVSTGLGGGSQQSYTREGGVFSFDRVPTGRATLSAEELGGLDRGRGAVDVATSDNDGASVVLNGVGVLLVVAQDASGNPVAGNVTLYGTGAFQWVEYVSVPASGSFRLAKALAGPVTAKLSAKPGDVTLYGTGSGAVAPDQEQELLVTLADSGSVTGRILRAGTLQAAYGADVTLQLAGVGNVTLSAREDGSFLATGVPLVRFDLRASDPVSGGVALVRDRQIPGNGETLVLGDVVLDDTAPLVAILDPPDGAVRESLAGPLELEIADEGAGIDLATLVVYYSSGQAQHAQEFSVAGGRAVGALRPSALGIGSNTLRVHVQDLAGRVGEATVTFRVLGATIRGRVLPAPGGVAAGARVSAGTLVGFADASGNFALAGLRGGSYSVLATDPQTGLTVQQPVVVADGGEASVDLPLPAFALVSGSVTRRATGTGAAGVLVTGPLGRQDETDATGRFELGALPLGTHVLEASDPATGDRGRATLVANVSGSAFVPIELNGVGALEVSVKRSGGSVVAGAEVSVVSSSIFARALRAQTGPAGEPAVFPRVFAGSLSVTASFDGLDAFTGLTLADTQARSVELRLSPAARVGGIVSQATSGVAAGATLRLSGAKSATTTTDANGEYAFENVPLGAFQLEASTGRGDRGVASGRLDLPDVTASVAIRLNGLGRVVVSVEDASGNQVNGAAVTLRSGALAGRTWLATTAAGVADVADVLAGEITASVRNPRNNEVVEVTGPLAADGRLDLELTLDPTATITGVVRNAGPGPVVEGVQVTIVGRAGARVTGADGAFSFADVPLGSYALQARVGGWLRGEAGPILLDEGGESVPADIELVVTGRVGGKVTKNAAAVAGASVDLTSRASPWLGSFAVVTDANGDYAIDNVPAGPFDVAARKGSDRREASSAMPASGGSLTLHLALATSAVSVPTPRADANGSGWTVGKAGSVNRFPMFPSGGTSPRLLIERDLVAEAFVGPCPLVAGCSVPSEEGQRELVLEQSGLHGLSVTRKVFVPVDGYFVRFLDLVTNPGTTPVTVNLVEEADLATSFVRGSSSNDTAASAADQWLVLDDGLEGDIWAPGGGGLGAFAPTVFAGSGDGGTAPTSLSAAPTGGLTRVTQRWDGVTLAPGETRALLHFVAAQSDQARAVATGERLVLLPPEALVGLAADEAAAVFNFDVPADLVGSVAPLPANDGVVEVMSYSGDRETTFRPSVFAFRSDSRYYGRPLTNFGYFSGSAPFLVSLLPDLGQGRVVPRGPFRLEVTSATPLGTLVRSASASFPPESGTSRVDVVFEESGTLAGSVLRADGSAIAGGSVVLSRGVQSVTVNLFGGNAFLFAAVPAGTYSLTSNHPLGDDQQSVAGILLPGPCTPTAAGPACEKLTRDIVYPAKGAVTGVVKTAAGFEIRARLDLVATGFSRSIYSLAGTGRFQFDDVPPGSYTLTATDDTRSGARVSRSILVTTGPDADVALTLLPVGTAQVTVRSGPATLASAAVYWQADVRGPGFAFGNYTNGSGVASFTVAGDPFRVRVYHPVNSRLYGETEGRITAEAELVPLLVTLPEVGTVSGVIRSRAGTPVGAQAFAMNAERSDYHASYFAGSNGVFSLAGLPREPFFLRGEIASGYPTLWSVADEPAVLSGATLSADARVPVGNLASDATEVWELEVPAAANLSVGLQGWAHAGLPALSSYALELFAPDGALAASADGVSAPSYAFHSLTNAALGTWLVAARSTAGGSGGYRVGSTIRDLVHVFRPYAGGMVEVSVRRGALMVPGLPVTLTNARADLPSAERTRSGSTGALGVYRVPTRTGPLSASLVDPATGATHTAAGELAADGTLRLRIELPERPTILTGRVTNGDGSSAIPLAYVQLFGVSGVSAVGTDASGFYRFDDVPPGSYTLRASYLVVSDTPLVLTGGAVTRDVPLPIAVVRGQVRESAPDGSAVPGAVVELCVGPACSSSYTDAEGSFLFYRTDRAAAAVLRALVNDGSGITTGYVLIPWSDGFFGTVERELVLPPSAGLRVTVNAPGGGPAEGALVEVYRDDPYGTRRLREPLMTDANGQVSFRHFTAAERVRVYAEQDESVGQAFVELAIGDERPVAITLAQTGRLDVGAGGDPGPTQGTVTVEAIEHPGRFGGVWTRSVQLYESEGGSWFRQTIRVPVGAFRVVLPGDETAGVEEGVLGAGETIAVDVRPGTHVRVPSPLPGDGALFVGEIACPPPCSGFARTRLPGAEEYPPFASPQADGRSLRSLLVAGSGVRVRRLQYAPSSGAFGRTLTLVTNPGTTPRSVPLDTLLVLDEGPDNVVTPSGGAVDATTPWVVVQHASGVQGLVLGSTLAPEMLQLVDEAETDPRLESRHRLAVEPGETVGLLTFTLVGTGGDTAALEARAAALLALTEPDALFGLSNEERAAIINFGPLPPRGDLAVEVTFSAGAVTPISVGLLDDAQALVARATAAPDGTALFAGLVPGAHTLVAVDAAGRPGRAALDVPAGTLAADTVAAEVELLDDGAIGGVDVFATWDGTTPAPDVRLALEATGWSPVWRPVSQTDENGLVSFLLVPPGSVQIRPQPPSVGASLSVDVLAGFASPAPLVIEPYASLVGQVFAGDGATPLANAPVVAIDADSDSVLASGRTDESGAYRLDGVRPGTGGVLVRAASPYDASVTIESEVVTPALPGTTGLSPMVLPVGVITGQVSRGSGYVRHPAVVARDSSGRGILAEWTDANGNFRIVGVASGPVTVTVVDTETGDRASESIEMDPASAQSLYFYVGPILG